MAIKLTAEHVRRCFPRAPQAVIDGFVNGQEELAKAGVLNTPTRLAYCLANLGHETSGFTIANLTENINYTAARMAQVWPNRFRTAAAVRAKYGTAIGWQRKAFDDIYGGRMGNRIGTNDGSRYIGRGGPQITGRDGYAQVGRRAGLPLEAQPELAILPENQAAIAAAFWSWKNMNRFADAGNFRGCVVAWNGGTNGLADRVNWLNRLLPICKEMPRVVDVARTDAPVISGDPEVWHVQRRLKAMMYLPGGLDGIWGGMTAGAITGFLNDRESKITPPSSAEDFRKILPKLKAAISKAEAENFTRPIAPERAEATSADIAPRMPDVQASITAERLGFWGSIAAGVSTTVTGISQFLGDAVEWLNPLKGLIGDIPWPVWIGGALVLSASLYFISRKSGQAKDEATKAFQEGSRL